MHSATIKWAGMAAQVLLVASWICLGYFLVLDERVPYWASSFLFGAMAISMCFRAVELRATDQIARARVLFTLSGLTAMLTVAYVADWYLN